MNHLPYLFKEAMISLKSNQSVSMVALLSISFTLMLFGLFLLIYFNVTVFVHSLQEEIRVILYLKDGTTDKTLGDLRKRLGDHQAVQELSYTSKPKALEEFSRYQEGNDLLVKGLGENPLPASLELTLKEDFREAKSVRKLAGEFKSLEGVDEVQYGREWVDNINTILQILRVASAVGGMVLGLAAMVIISNTIGLTVWARLSEIEVLKMIGATRWYIQAPFLLEGCVLGFVGGLFSIFFLHLIFLFAQTRLVEAGGFLGRSLALNFLPPQWLVLYLMIGVFLGFAGGLFSTRRLV